MGEVSVEDPHGISLFRSAPGYVLAVLLAVLLLAAVACPRDPEGLAAPEVTYLAAAQSLIADLDWQFGSLDRKRIGELPRSADDLLLRPSISSESPAYDVPAIYPVILAPFVWLAPLRGPVIANVLLLALAVVAATKSLGQRLGRAAVAMIAVCLFASVMYRSVFLISPTMLLVACVAIGFHLCLRHEEPAAHGLREVYRPPETTSSAGGRGVAIGGLLGLVAVHHPLYLFLALPAAVSAPAERRRSAMAGLISGLALVLFLSGLLDGLWGLSMSDLGEGFGGEKFQASIALTTWNLLYFAVGRNVGLLPYFLPLVALLGLWKGGSGRSVLVVTALLGSLAFLVLAPFNFFNGPAAIGNAWLIPWFVLLWFVPTRPLPRGWLVATVLLAAPAMYPTWLAPSVEPVTADGVYRHSSGRLHSFLPLETTQEPLPPGEVMGSRFWIRSLSLEARVSGASRWLLTGKGWSELHVAAPTELAAVHLQFGPQAEASLEVRGADLGDMVLLPDGGVGFRLENLRRKGLHSMWWSREQHFNYVLRFRMPMEEARAQTLTITAIAADLERTRP